MPNLPPRINRRRFLAASATAAVAPVIVPASALGLEGSTPPSERINVGVVGLGSRAFNLLDEFLNHSDARVTAICDVDEFHYRDRPWGSKGPVYGRTPGRQRVERKYGAGTKSGRASTGLTVVDDFREICSREDIDAVVVATPDHWHALCTLTALRAGKDVYCEKPVTHFFREGQLVYREVAKQNAIFQTGSQQRSDFEFRQAVELVINGHIGTVQRVEVGLPPGYDKPQGDTKVVAPPESLDYDLWCGPGPKLPYMRARHHRWWRGHRAFGGGVLMDWIGHHNDIAHWALGADKSGPTKVEAVGWTFPDTNVYDTPHHYEIRCEYAGGVTASIGDVNKLGTKFIGESGWIHVTRGRLTASDKRLAARNFKPGPRNVYRSPGHTRNFLDSIRTRQECICPAETAHRSITPGHLAYVSQQLSRPLTWNASTEQVINDGEANQLLNAMPYRMPWSV
ncbi:MAG: Gfo/Idh/MocA family protein [Planctomycetota bacterium]|jgi:predicted dehydrogenase